VSRRKSGITKLKKLLWTECKRITRARHGYVCYTCGKPTEAPHTGHFITSSTCSVELRYDLDNLRPQCYHCNINLSGNWIAFEAHLMVERGRDFPDQLKQRNRDTMGKQYDSLWYINKIEEYKKIGKEPKIDIEDLRAKTSWYSDDDTRG